MSKFALRGYFFWRLWIKLFSRYAPRFLRIHRAYYWNAVVAFLIRTVLFSGRLFARRDRLIFYSSGRLVASRPGLNRFPYFIRFCCLNYKWFSFFRNVRRGVTKKGSVLCFQFYLQKRFFVLFKKIFDLFIHYICL